MALYLGGRKYKLLINNTAVSIPVYTPAPRNEVKRLVSADNCVIKDANNLILMVKEDK